MTTAIAQTLIAEITADDGALAQLAAALMPFAKLPEDGWMDSKAAAAYLGFGSTSPLKKLTAARAIPFEQDARGGKCWFKRSELDRWRAGGCV